MEDDNTGAVIAGAAALGAAAINAGSQAYTNSKQMQLAKYGYEQQRQMIAEQNLYNSPAKQIERYKEAGLNPNLIYGEGKASAGNQSDIAKYNAPSLRAPEVDFNSVLQGAMAFRGMVADLQLKKEQVKNMQVQNSILQEDWAEKNLKNNALYLLFGNREHASGMNETQLNEFLNSEGFASYRAEAGQYQLMNDYRKASTDFQNLKVKEQEYINQNFLKIQKDYYILRNKGFSNEVAMSEIRKKLNQELSAIGGEKGATLIWSVIRFLLQSSLLMNHAPGWH